MSFKISDKVVCVDDADSYAGSRTDFVFLGFIERGRIYVVSDTWDDYGFGRMQDQPRVGLVGLSCVSKKRGIEVGWAARRFRKLSEIQSENKASRKNLLKIEASKLGHTLIFV